MISYGVVDTIVAPATPVLSSALCVIRVSGKDSFFLLGRSLNFLNQKKIDEIPSFFMRRALFVDFENASKIIDDVMVVVMRSPKSYTGEDMVEITCHGNPLIVNLILQKIQKSGARLALPGEFTQRSFLLGKKDLTQAEAVCDLIASRSEESLQRSLRSLLGDFHSEIKKIIEKLEHLLLYLEAELDFFEEEIDFLNEEDFLKKIDEINEKVSVLAEKFYGSALSRKGISFVIVGPPNVGKSSLLNAFFKSDRVLVTDQAGTTRDVVDVEILLGKYPVRFFDTAGIRKTENLIEQQGVLKSFEFLARADSIFFLSSWDCFDDSHKILFNKIEKKKKKNQDFFFIVNKEDLLNVKTKKMIEKKMGKIPWAFVSTRDEKSVRSLENKMIETIEKKFSIDSSDMMINQRQQKLLQEAMLSLKEAKKMNLNEFQAVIVISLREALSCLHEIIGQQYNKDILNKIFSQFCVGK